MCRGSRNESGMSAFCYCWYKTDEVLKLLRVAIDSWWYLKAGYSLVYAKRG